METKHARLVAQLTRRVIVIEEALEVVARHVANDALAQELHAMADARADDEAASLLWRLARRTRK